jgi:xylulokinase
MTRAVMEGATYALRDSLEIMRAMGVKASEIRLSGGGAKSAFWRQMQADIYGCDTCVTSSTAGSAYGAMLLGGVGAGVWASVPEACDATIRIVKRTKRSARAVREYDRFYPIYAGMYAKLQGSFTEIARVIGH